MAAAARSWTRIAPAVAVLAIAFLILRPHHDRCRVHWRVGDIDPRFNVSKLDVVNAATAAADTWNAAAGRRVLFYDTKHGIPLNLVYDVHHAAVSTDRARREEVRRLGSLIDNLRAQFEQNPSEYLAGRINHYIDQYNRLVAAYNAQAIGDVQQGSFDKVLEVYAFADLVDLQYVMTHEFGHALGIGHLTAADAIMNARHVIGTEESLQLRGADVSALRAKCR